MGLSFLQGLLSNSTSGRPKDRKVNDLDYVRHNMALQFLDTLDHVRKSLNDRTSRTCANHYRAVLTPVSIARFMASLFELVDEKVRILDPGAGAGVLFASCVDALVSRRGKSLAIEVVAYENDRHILPALKRTMERCEKTCKDAGIPFRVRYE